MQSLDASSGRTLCETDDPAALSQWCREWADAITLTATPVADEHARRPPTLSHEADQVDKLVRQPGQTSLESDAHIQA